MDSAPMVGDRRRVGTVTLGKLADLVGVRGDPLADGRTIEQVDFVMKNGIVHVAPGAHA